MTTATTHRSQVWPGLGKSFVLQDVETPKEIPRDHVLIKVTAVAVNPGDYKIQEAYKDVIQLDFPSNLGLDGVGFVAVVGEDVKQLVKGDRVLFNGFPGFLSGGYQEYSLQPSFAVGKVPAQLSDVQAATVPVGSATALSLFEFLGIPPPWENPSFGNSKNIFVPAGASSVGQYTIQLARLSGFSRIFTSGSAHNEALLRSLGATHFIDRNLSLKEQVEEIFDKVGAEAVPFVADAMSSLETLEISFAVAQKNSKGSGKVGSVMFVPEDLSTRYSDVASGYMFGNVRNNPVTAARFFENFPVYVADGVYHPNRARVIGKSLEAVKFGVELMKKGVSGEKLVITYEV